MTKLSEIDFEAALDRVESEPNSSAASILRCAEALFSTKGFKAVTTRDIAKASGKNISTIHFHWQSKRSLYEAVCRMHARQLLAFVSQTEAAIADSTLKPNQALEQWIDKTLDLLIENPAIAKLASQNISVQNNPEMVTLFEHDVQVLARFQGYLSTFLGPTDDHTKPMRLFTLLYFTIGMFTDSLLQQAMLGGSIYEQPELQQQLKSFAKNLAMGLLQKDGALTTNS